MICTPSCPICLKNYNQDCKPMTIQPCGHGGCEKCIDILFARHTNPTCPICRTNIEKKIPNYDLRTITDCVEADPTYWGRRLIEIVRMPGEEINISDSIRPYCQLLCYRFAFEPILDEIKEEMTLQQQEEVDKLRYILTKCLHKNDVAIEDAYKWLKVLNVKPCVEIYLVEKILEWYETKYFLEKHDALWIIDALRI